MNVPRLLRRPKPALCNIADGYILTSAQPDDLPCPEPLQPVPAHCGTCGHITADTCPNHGRRCPTCTLADEPSRVELVETVAVP